MDSIKPTFIESVQQHNGSWTPPVLPALNDPGWKTAWDQSTEAERTNLGNAWIWIYQNQLKALSDEKTSTTWLQNWEWIARIVPYTGDTFLKLSDLCRTTDTHDTIIYLQNIAGSAWSQVRDIWFAETDDLRIAALQEFMEAGHENSVRDAYGPLLAELAWDVARLPGASAKHHLYAGKLSIHGGYMYTADENASPSAQVWSKLRRHARANQRAVLSIEAKTKIKEMLENEPLCVALPLFCVLMERNSKGKNVYYTERGVVLPKDNLLAFGCEGEAYPYAVLRAWFPKQTKLFDVAETLGLTIEEACKKIMEANTESLIVNMPNDIGGFEITG